MTFAEHFWGALRDRMSKSDMDRPSYSAFCQNDSVNLKKRNDANQMKV